MLKYRYIRVTRSAGSLRLILGLAEINFILGKTVTLPLREETGVHIPGETPYV